MPTIHDVHHPAQLAASRVRGMLLPLLLLGVGWASPASAQPLVHATASNGAWAQAYNGVVSTLVPPDTTAAAGPEGAGVTTAWAQAAYVSLNRQAYGSADLSTGRVGGRISGTPGDDFAVGVAFGAIADNIVFTNTTGAPLVMPLTWTFSGTISATGPPSAGALENRAIIEVRPPSSVLPAPTLRGTTHPHQTLYFLNNDGVRTFFNQLSGQTYTFGTSPIWDIYEAGPHGAQMVSSLTIPPGQSHVRLSVQVRAICRLGLSCNFENAGHGGVLSFGQNPPPGLSMTTESGAFLGIQPSPTPPSAPTNLQATVSGNTIALNWERPSSGSPATTFDLRARTSAGGPVLATLPMGDTTSYSVQAPNGTFVLSVVAANGVGVSPESAPVTVTTPAPFVPPSAPLSLSASAAGDAAIFTWLPPTTGGAVVSYTLLAGTSPGFTTPLAVLPIPPNRSSTTVLRVPAGTYYARLVASNQGGTSAPSNEVTLVVTGPAAPSAPALAATAAGSTVTLTWTRGATGGLPAHYVLVARRPTGEPITTATLTGISASFPGVPSGTYVLTLTAVNAVGSSPASAPVTLVVP